MFNVFKFLKSLSPKTQGILYMVSGGVIILHALGAFQQIFSFVLGIGGIALIAYGFTMIDGVRKAKQIMAQLQKKK